jgi:phosphoribosylanthranilate isomerase
MSIKIKICVVTRPDHIEMLNTHGVELVGFNFYKPSPRYVTQDKGAMLAGRCRPGMERVALLVDPSDDEVDMAIAAVSPHRLQLHGAESPERLAEIKSRSHCAIIKALPIAKKSDLKKADDYQAADWFLFDAKPPQDETDAASSKPMPGGNGTAFDWKLLADYDQSRPYLLAGGLNAENVGAALTISGASMVDIASGVEGAPGEKDSQLVADFVAAVRERA